MFNILRLVQNENLKIYKRMSTWIMISLLILSVVIGGIATKFLMNPNDGNPETNWKEELQVRNEQLQMDIEQIENAVGAGSATKPLEEEVLINNYRIENDIAPVESETLWGFMISAPNFTTFASLFAIVIGAGIVASEFSTGTIKLLLIRPVNRYKILLSKYLATLLFAFLLVLLIFITAFIVGSIMYGFQGIDLPYLVYTEGQFVEKNMLNHIITLFGLNSVNLIMMVTFAFMISTVFRSSSLAIGLSLFLMFTGQQIVMLLSQYDWVKYILFANTDLTQYFSGSPVVEGMTLTFSVTILAVYFLFFNVASWVIFQKRDVAA
ncbi:hypothetical protein GCM10011351_15760 [Paraliobacillus quinghaiensis]|uniref:ABC transporter permease n=1 Tax=Paraliobacillus quinghaiensis TaxID=470815 RepID=A0A917TNL4_9BACI|nr:ABC transporter permease [Paraliobacillus quinghaiensis]GGM30456.1 hypothetical protein GCM10011351_15760 [Paraliobacillus quinghaiensis]